MRSVLVGIALCLSMVSPTIGQTLQLNGPRTTAIINRQETAGVDLPKPAKVHKQWPWWRKASFVYLVSIAAIGVVYGICAAASEGGCGEGS